MSATRPASVIAQSGGTTVSEVGLEAAPSLAVTPSVTVAPLRRRAVETGATRRDSRLGLAAVGGLLAIGGVIAVAAAHTPMLLPESIRAAPLGLAGAFGAAGLNLHVGGEMAALVLMFLAYAAVVTLAGQLSARVVLIAIAALYAMIVLAPPLASTDVFSYQAYARMGALYHVNPYTHGPWGINPDPVYSYVGAKWYDIHSTYGPVFTIFSYLLAPLTIVTSVFAYKSIAVVAGLALVAVVWQCARLRGTDPVKAAALVGLNPLLVLYGIGGGHNDLLMLLAMTGGVYAVLASREALGGGLGMLAVGVKLTAGLVLPFALAAPGRGGRPQRGRWRLALGIGAGIAALAAVSIGVFGSGSVNMLGAVIKSQREGGWMSIPGAISTRLDLPTVGAIAGFVLAGAFAVVLCWLLRRVWRGEMDWIDGAAWAMLAMLVASSSLLPWYVAWLLPLTALARDRRLALTAIVFTGLVQGITLLGYIPHGFM